MNTTVAGRRWLPLLMTSWLCLGGLCLGACGSPSEQVVIRVTGTPQATTALHVTVIPYCDNLMVAEGCGHRYETDDIAADTLEFGLAVPSSLTVGPPPVLRLDALNAVRCVLATASWSGSLSAIDAVQLSLTLTAVAGCGG